MFKYLQAKYYQNNKERLQKKAGERYQHFLMKKKKKSGNTVVNETKTYQKMKNKNLLSVEKNITK